MTSNRTERRTLPRAAARTEAVLVSADGVDRQPATIRNVSRKGALVELSEAASVVGETYLLLPGHGMQPIKPIWHKRHAMGVEYPDDEA